MMACWKLPSPRSQAYVQSDTGLADAQRYAVGAGALLQEASNAKGLSANANLLSLQLIRVLNSVAKMESENEM